MKCPQCQTGNPEDAKFCEQCGTQLLCKCPGCGAEVSQTARFCKECGHSLAEPATATPPLPSLEPISFAGGRYQVKEFIGEGGKKKVSIVKKGMYTASLGLPKLAVFVYNYNAGPRRGKPGC